MVVLLQYITLGLGAVFIGILGAVSLSPLAGVERHPEEAQVLQNVDHLVREADVELTDAKRPEDPNPAATSAEMIAASSEEATHENQEPILSEFSGQSAAVNSALNEPRFPTEGAFAPHNKRAREAVVNIFCSRTTGRTTRTTTGSGIIIDPRGVILTNAHVAELFALTKESRAGKPSCTVRTGTPARDAYEAELLYLPENWVRTFAPKLGESNPTGTGEEDFALLLITDTAKNEAELPETFPFVPFTTNPLSVRSGEQVLIVSYPAIVGSLSSIRGELFLVSTLSRVTELFTFDRSHLDLFALEGNIAATRGSSGGAVINQLGEIVGIVVTSSKGDLTLERELRALTVEHMNRRIAAERDESLRDYLEGDLEKQALRFQKNQMPELVNLLLER